MRQMIDPLADPQLVMLLAERLRGTRRQHSAADRRAAKLQKTVAAAREEAAEAAQQLAELQRLLGEAKVAKEAAEVARQQAEVEAAAQRDRAEAAEQSLAAERLRSRRLGDEVGAYRKVRAAFKKAYEDNARGPNEQQEQRSGRGGALKKGLVRIAGPQQGQRTVQPEPPPQPAPQPGPSAGPLPQAPAGRPAAAAPPAPAVSLPRRQGIARMPERGSGETDPGRGEGMGFAVEAAASPPSPRRPPPGGPREPGSVCGPPIRRPICTVEIEQRGAPASSLTGGPAERGGGAAAKGGSPCGGAPTGHCAAPPRFPPGGGGGGGLAVLTATGRRCFAAAASRVSAAAVAAAAALPTSAGQQTGFPPAEPGPAPDSDEDDFVLVDPDAGAE